MAEAEEAADAERERGEVFAIGGDEEGAGVTEAAAALRLAAGEGPGDGRECRTTSCMSLRRLIEE